MNKPVKYILMIMISLLLSYFCFILPPRISEWTDRKMTGEINLEPLEEMNVNLNQQMTMLEKLDLMLNADNASNNIAINQGKEMTGEEAIQTCISEINTLISLGIITDWPSDIQEKNMTAYSYFYISSDDPAKTMILWNIMLKSEQGITMISMDDESGKILGINSKLIKDNMNGVYNISDSSVITKLGDYLGLDITADQSADEDYLKKSAYRVAPFVLTVKDGDSQLQCVVFLSGHDFYFTNMDSYTKILNKYFVR